MPHRIFASKNHDGNIPVDGIWGYEDYGSCQITEYVRADFTAELADALARLIRVIGHDDLTVNERALIAKHRAKSAEAGNNG
jgi:hypothetical protein